MTYQMKKLSTVINEALFNNEIVNEAIDYEKYKHLAGLFGSSGDVTPGKPEVYARLCKSTDVGKQLKVPYLQTYAWGETEKKVCNIIVTKNISNDVKLFTDFGVIKFESRYGTEKIFSKKYGIFANIDLAPHDLQKDVKQNS